MQLLAGAPLFAAVPTVALCTTMRAIHLTLVLAMAAAFAPAPRARGLSALSSFKVTLVDPSGEQKTFDCPEDETILDAAEEILGLELPASCRSGSCTSCQGRLVKGTVEQEEAHTLEEEHLDAGYVCTCVAYPTSDLTILTYQEEAFEDNDMDMDGPEDMDFGDASGMDDHATSHQEGAPAEEVHQRFLQKGNGRSGRPQSAAKGATEEIACYG